jgi:cobalamin biosynthesis Mg chelatase CobN
MVMEGSVQHFSAFNKQVNMLLIDNPERKVMHTQQVELNGFIHSVLIGTKEENNGYRYFKQRSYTDYIQ